MITCFADEISPILHEQLALLDSLGIENMELRSMWNVGVLELTEPQLEDISYSVRARGKSVTCISSPIGKCPYDYPMSDTMRQLEKALTAARIMHTDRIRIFSWQIGGMPRDARLFDEVSSRLKTMTARAESDGVTLVMENSAVGAGDTGANCRRIIETVGSRYLRLAFDPASFVAAGERPFDESYRDAKDVIGYVHIKDIVRGASGRVPAGEGDGQLPQLTAEFCREPSLCLSLEPHLAHFGAAGGFSGPENFSRAYHALKRLIK